MKREIDAIYKSLCADILKFGVPVGNTKELTNIKITLHDIEHNIVSIRDLSPSYLFGEWLWYFTGRRDTNFISKFGAMWSRLTDDGKNANSAYGWLMKSAFGFDQIEKVIELLKTDPHSRRAVININTPNPNVIETKDEPCTIMLQFLLRDGKLYCTTVMRSNDIYLGFPYDIAFFTEVQKIIADRLKVEYGTYTHFATSFHVYDRDLPVIREIASKPITSLSKPIIFDRNKFHMCKWQMSQIVKNSNNAKEKVIELMKEFCDLEIKED